LERGLRLHHGLLLSLRLGEHRQLLRWRLLLHDRRGQLVARHHGQHRLPR